MTGNATTDTDGDDRTDTRIEIRPATHDDGPAVEAMTERIWTDRGGDYINRVYHDWLEDDDETGKRTFLADVVAADGDDPDEVAGIVQAVMLSADEAWFQGMRVHPDHRRRGVSKRLNEAAFAWAREQGATVGRMMTFSWNAPALGAARGGGFEPITEFRWAEPTPDPDAAGPAGLEVTADPTAAWRYWSESDAREHLRGLALSHEESWALRELTREDLAELADETAVFSVRGPDGLRGMAYRSRDYERTNDDGETVHRAEYGAGAWDDVDAARALVAAIARDAAAIGADRTRVLIPETAAYVSDASYAGAGLSEEPDFVLGIDLAGDRLGSGR